jgi:hypothetical protein
MEPHPLSEIAARLYQRPDSESIAGTGEIAPPPAPAVELR